MDIFTIQNKFFEDLKLKLKTDVKVFKIFKKKDFVKDYNKFVYIENISEEILISGRKQFTIVIHLQTDSFDYKVIQNFLTEVKSAITTDSMAKLNGFINLTEAKTIVYSDINKGYSSTIEFICFFI